MRRPTNLKLDIATTIAGLLAATVGCNPVRIQGEGGGPPIPNGVGSGTTVSTTFASSTVTSTAAVCLSTVATGLTTGSGWSSITCGQCEETTVSSCDDCSFGCAERVPCSNQANAFHAVGGAEAWLQCARACPPDTGMHEFRTCMYACNAAYPGVEQAYLPLLDCVACHFCTQGCGGQYGDCSMLLAPPPA